MEIRQFNKLDYPKVRRIYQHGLDTGHASFQERAPAWEDWDSAMMDACRFIAQDNEIILGWAALSPVSNRCVYTGIAEVSVYVSPDAQGKGVGNTLLEALIISSEAAGIWTLQAGIFPENTGSIALHKKNAFKVVGVREKFGCMNGVWRDVVLLERRSQCVGI